MTVLAVRGDGETNDVAVPVRLMAAGGCANQSRESHLLLCPHFVSLCAKLCQVHSHQNIGRASFCLSPPR